MAKIEYLVKTIDTCKTDGELFIELYNESENGLELCGILQKADEGTTDSNATFIFKKNHELITTYFVLSDEKEIQEKYLTANQIKLIREIEEMIINGDEYFVSHVNIQYDYDDDDFYATINLLRK